LSSHLVKFNVTRFTTSMMRFLPLEFKFPAHSNLGNLNKFPLALFPFCLCFRVRERDDPRPTGSVWDCRLLISRWALVILPCGAVSVSSARPTRNRFRTHLFPIFFVFRVIKSSPFWQRQSRRSAFEIWFRRNLWITYRFPWKIEPENLPIPTVIADLISLFFYLETKLIDFSKWTSLFMKLFNRETNFQLVFVFYIFDSSCLKLDSNINGNRESNFWYFLLLFNVWDQRLSHDRTSSITFVALWSGYP
jgi:hypothetical protein